MKQDVGSDTALDGLSYVLVAGLLFGIVTLIQGCTVSGSVDWHGKTGVDHRTQTQLVNTEQPKHKTAY